MSRRCIVPLIRPMRSCEGRSNMSCTLAHEPTNLALYGLVCSVQTKEVRDRSEYCQLCHMPRLAGGAYNPTTNGCRAILQPFGVLPALMKHVRIDFSSKQSNRRRFP